MLFAFSEKPFQLSVSLRMLYPGQYWLDAVFFEAIFEFAVSYRSLLPRGDFGFARRFHRVGREHPELGPVCSMIPYAKRAELEALLRQLSSMNGPPKITTKRARIQRTMIPLSGSTSGKPRPSGRGRFSRLMQIN